MAVEVKHIATNSSFAHLSLLSITVFGWTAGFKFMAEEQDEAYLLDIGYLKGAVGLENRTLQFDVMDMPETAGGISKIKFTIIVHYLLCLSFA